MKLSGAFMLNRLTVSALLKAVILVTSFCVVVAISLNAWESWGRLQAASRITVIAETSANLFKAMHNLRTDRSTTFRLLNADPADGRRHRKISARPSQFRNARHGPRACAAAVDRIRAAEHAGARLDRLFKLLTALQKEFWDEVAKPKASRRASMPQEYYDATAASLQTLDKLSAALAAAVNHQDATIDQFLAIKQSAWLLRNTAGEASLLISKGLAAGRVSPGRQADLHEIPRRHRDRIDLAGNGGSRECSCRRRCPPRSPRPRPRISKPECLALRDRLLTTLMAGEKPELTANQWSPITVGRMGSAVTVAERALDAAKEHAMAQRSGALRSLVLQLTLAGCRTRIDVRRHDRW